MLDIRSDEWNRKTGRRLEAECRCHVHSIKRPQTSLLDEILSLAQDNGSNLHKFPITSIFVQP